MLYVFSFFFFAVSMQRKQKGLRNLGLLRLWMPFFVMTPEVSLWDLKMFSATVSLVSFLFSAAFFAPSDLPLSLRSLSSTLPAKLNLTFISGKDDDGIYCRGGFLSATREGCSRRTMLGGYHPRTATAFLLLAKLLYDL